MRKITLVAVSLVMLGVSGCSSLGVEPWEEGSLRVVIWRLIAKS